MKHQKSTSFVAGRSGRADRGTFMGTVRLLLPYIWPADRPDLRLRVLLAIVLMVASKLFTIATPYAFKWVTDALAAKNLAQALQSFAFLRAVVVLTVTYGLLRVGMSLTQQGRDALFASVAMNGVRKLAIEVFVHLHQLSLRFHLERKTGGLTRVLERGRNAIETIIRTSMLTAVPTLVEFAFVIAALFYSFDWRYVAAILITVLAYLVFTTIATNWRISIRRSMNESDSDANTKAIDSLLNFETVKYFGAEEREAARYDKAMARYERLSVRTYIIAGRAERGAGGHFHLRLDRTARDVRLQYSRGAQYRGRFRAAEHDDAAALSTAQFHGHGVSRHQAGDRRHRGDVRHPRPDIRKSATRPARAISRSPGARSVSRTSSSITTRTGRSCGEYRSRRRRATRSPSSALPGRESRRFRACCFGSMSPRRVGSPSMGRISRAVTQASLRAAIGMVPQDTVLFNDIDPLQHPLRPRRLRATRRSRRRRKTRRSTPSFARCRRATARRSASAA